jgi:aerotaxis receptor
MKPSDNVVKVIASIAHQTTMLALNAEIEVTRAWNAGRAFAVIADEVKELSMRSISAAEDIAEKLNVTVNKVSGGNLQSDYARAEIELF